MWTYSKESAIEEVKIGGNFLDRSGAYEMFIEEISEKKTSGGANQIVFKFKTSDEAKTTCYFPYTNVNGEELDFKVRHLNHLSSLIKVMPDKMEDMVGKKVGVFLKAKLSKDGKYINFDIDGFYDAKTKLTTKEIADKKTTPDVYNKAVEKYGQEAPLIRSTVDNSATNKGSTKVENDDDSFPF